jgi:ABC-type branched-subunit amino acid transport system ATPase component
MINCISRYYEPSRGGIRYDGTDLRRRKPHQLAKLGMARTFQELSLPPTLSVLESVMLGQHSQNRTNLIRALVDFNYLQREDRKYRRQARDTLRFIARATTATNRAAL